MSGFTGQTKTTSGTPAEIMPVRKQGADWLGKQNLDQILPGSPDMAPFLKMFQDQSAMNFATAKEGAGNLTGSGYGTAVGEAAARGTTEQGAFLAQMAEKHQQDNANRLLQFFSSLSGSGVAPPSTSYQPGFLDYLGSAGASVGTALAGRPRSAPK